MVEQSGSRLPMPKKPAIKVPPGYRFRPTDKELLVHYLMPKVYNQPLMADIIEEVDLYKDNPDALTQDRKGEGEWYCFTPRDRKYPNGSRPTRTAGNGFWKATGADKKVEIEGKHLGNKKTLVYYYGKAGKSSKSNKTNWIMYEFVLVDTPRRERAGMEDMRLDNWVLCKVYKKQQNLKGASERSANQKLQEAAEDHPMPDATPTQAQAEAEAAQHGGNIPQVIMEEQRNGRFRQVGDHFNNMPQQAYGVPIYNGYGASSSISELLPEFPQSLDHLGHYSAVFPHLAVSGCDDFIPTVAPVSSIPPPHDHCQQFAPVSSFQQFAPFQQAASPVSMINAPLRFNQQQPFPSLPDFEFSNEDAYLLNMDLDFSDI